MDYNEEFNRRITYIETVLNKYLPQKEGLQKEIMEAMHYGLLGRGKRIRPMLVHEVYTLLGGNGCEVEPFMAAVEMVHTYSLIHDDLPAMDDDEYRRGRKTTHVVYGEAMGILTGDALLNYAFEILSGSLVQSSNMAAHANAMHILAKKSGIYGMLGGQVVDVTQTNKKINRKTLDFIYKLKTGALIEAAMMIGAVMAGVGNKEVEVMEEIATEIGMAFQIRDDILDVSGDVEILGKPVLSDQKNHKTTYVTLMGPEEADKEVRRLSKSAISKIHSINSDNEFLNELIIKLIYREK